MTWIKPSLLWMAYRSGWATKPGQERVLSIEILRTGFEWALANSSLSHFDPTVHDSQKHWKNELADNPVRVQWDPERSLTLEPLPHRAIQIGLGAEVVGRYVDEWILDMTDITDHFRRIDELVCTGEHAQARMLLPDERAYPIPKPIAERLGVSSDGAA